MKTILTTQQIINTYDEHQQEQCKLYGMYKDLKRQNPEFGYKRISKLLDQPYGKTRWWHAGKYTPFPVSTVEWLKEKGFLPLEEDNVKLTLIAKVLGCTFGDGGIFGNLNAIFLSSSELEAVKEFGEDLKILFGNEIDENSRIIEGGEYGHSWCYQNTNRNVIRFFQALGAPIGDKSFTDLIVPDWIKESREGIQNEFFGSIFGNELGVPKIHISKTHLDTLSLGLTATEKFAENRKQFLGDVAAYLNKKEIATGSISINDHKHVNRKGEPTKIYNLLFSVTFENVVNFMTMTKINYCKYKMEKLGKTMNEFAEIKRQRYNDLEKMGYEESAILKLLNLNEAIWFVISNYEDFSKIYEVELGENLITAGIEV
ncbi:MAG: hypothetical protein WC595_04055 [Candidatus Nanoarchaeia archaeon]